MGPIHVITINVDAAKLKQRRHFPPPVQIHQKEKGRGSYVREKPNKKNGGMEM